jgi:hypothetical protein
MVLSFMAALHFGQSILHPDFVALLYRGSGSTVEAVEDLNRHASHDRIFFGAIPGFSSSCGSGVRVPRDEANPVATGQDV